MQLKSPWMRTFSAFLSHLKAIPNHTFSYWLFGSISHLLWTQYVSHCLDLDNLDQKLPKLKVRIFHLNIHISRFPWNTAKSYNTRHSLVATISKGKFTATLFGWSMPAVVSSIYSGCLFYWSHPRGPPGIWICKPWSESCLAFAIPRKSSIGCCSEQKLST